MARATSLLAASLAAGCFNPLPPNGIHCADSEPRCPSGYQCRDGRCFQPGQGADGGASDGGAPADMAACAEASGPAPPALGQPCCRSLTCAAGATCDGARCVPTVAPYACAPGSPRVQVIAETPPPPRVAPWARPYVSVTVANCSSATWGKGRFENSGDFALATGIVDDRLLTPGPVTLPADVPTGSRVTIGVELHMPPLTGPRMLAWGIAQKDRGYLDAIGPARSFAIEAAPRMATICAGVQADIGGGQSASAALQTCIDQTPLGGTLSLPAGIYRIATPLTIAVPSGPGLTLTTAGVKRDDPPCLDYDGPPCVVLRADENVLPSQRGFIATSGQNIVLDHIVVDGNRERRAGSMAAQQCATGAGINVAGACVNCQAIGSGFARALCGSGLEWQGNTVGVLRSVFRENGTPGNPALLADGLTLVSVPEGGVDDCRFVDNSDVGVRLGDAPGGAVLASSRFRQSVPLYAAIFIDGLKGNIAADFADLSVRSNDVQCDDHCQVGIQIGRHVVDSSAPNVIVKGASLDYNFVAGAGILVDVEGAGTAAAPLQILGNNAFGAPSAGGLACGGSGGSAVNIGGDSFATTAVGSATTFTVHDCGWPRYPR